MDGSCLVYKFLGDTRLCVIVETYRFCGSVSQAEESVGNPAIWGYHAEPFRESDQCRWVIFVEQLLSNGF